MTKPTLQGGATDPQSAKSAVPAVLPWSRRLRIYVLTILCIVSALNFIDRQVLSILVEDIKADLHINDTQIGLLTGLAFAGFYIIAGVPLARLADTRSRRAVIAGCLAFWSLATVFCGLGRNYVQLLFARMGVAAGEAGGAPGAQSMMADVYPLSQRTTVFAILTSAQAAGIAFGLFAGGWLNELFGWRMVFIIVGAPGILIAALMMLTVPEPARQMTAAGAAFARASLGETIRFLWSQTSFRWILLGFGALSFTGYGVMSWAPAFFIRVHHLPTTQVGLVMGGAVAAGLTIGSMAGGVIADRLVARDTRWALRVSMIGAAAAVPFLALFLTMPSLALAATAFFLWNVCAGAVQSPAFALVQSLAPANMRATASFLITVIQNIIGVATGPLLIGMASDALAPQFGSRSIGLALLMTLVTATISAVAFGAGNRWVKRDLARIDAEDPTAFFASPRAH
ncbi:MAG: transporter [Brevundimonas sp.]|nr:transporter [Brevundimonas sp.]